MEIENQNQNSNKKQYQQTLYKQIKGLFQYEIVYEKIKCLSVVQQAGKVVTKECELFFTNVRLVIKIQDQNEQLEINLNNVLQNKKDSQSMLGGSFKEQAKNMDYFGKQIDRVYYIQFKSFAKMLLLFDTKTFDSFKNWAQSIWEQFESKHQEESYIKAIILSSDENMEKLYREMVYSKQVISEKDFWMNNRDYKELYLNKISNVKEQAQYKEEILKSRKNQKYQNDKEVDLNYTLEKGYDLEQFLFKEKSIIDEINTKSFQQLNIEIENPQQTNSQNLENEFKNIQIAQNSYNKAQQQDNKQEKMELEQAQNNQNKQQNQQQQDKQIQNQQLDQIQQHQQGFSQFQKQFSQISKNLDSIQQVQETPETKLQAMNIITSIAKVAGIDKDQQDDIEQMNQNDEFANMYKVFNFQVSELTKWFYKEQKIKNNKEKCQALFKELEGVKNSLKQKRDELQPVIRKMDQDIQATKKKSEQRVKEKSRRQIAWKISVLVELIQQIDIAQHKYNQTNNNVQ